MFSAMHFIYYINRSIATKVDSSCLEYSQTAHNVYMSYGNRWARTSDMEITSPTFTRHRHTNRHMSSSTNINYLVHVHSIIITQSPMEHKVCIVAVIL